MSEIHSHMNQTCSEIGKLIEKRASEDILTLSEQTLMEEHLESCSECNDFTKILFGMSVLPDEPSSLNIAQISSTIAGNYFGKKRRNRAIVLSIVSAAAITLFLLSIPYFNPTVESSETLARSVLVDSGAAPSCVPQSPFIAAPGLLISQCQETSVDIKIGSDKKVKISLVNGAFALSLDPRRPELYSVLVTTPLGTIEVKGTVLSVHVTKTNVRVEVFKGIVELRSNKNHDAALEVSAGNGAHLVAFTTFPLDVSWGKPLQIALESFEKSEHSNNSIQNENIILDIDTPTDDDLKNTRRTSNSALPNAQTRIVPLDILIQEAQSFLIAMDWNLAAQKYNDILRYYPKSPEAQSALISLAKIELRRLGHPQKALSKFNAYQTRNPKGPLAEEALLGIAEAHRLLGNKEAETVALQEFIKRFPASASVSKTKHRLRELNQ